MKEKIVLNLMMKATNINLRTNDFVDNLVNAGNDVIGAAQKIAPIAAAVCGVAAALMYMVSDRKADAAKSWGFKIFIAIGIIMGITSVIAWMQGVASF